MRYLITTSNELPFLTDHYEYDNNYNPKVDMIVYDLYHDIYTIDGKTWQKINIDHL
jgi:hypothetical protein